MTQYYEPFVQKQTGVKIVAPQQTQQQQPQGAHGGRVEMRKPYTEYARLPDDLQKGRTPFDFFPTLAKR